MKNKLTQLDVDFIGGQEPLTKEEELLISAFIKADKEKNKLRTIGKQKEPKTLKVLDESTNAQQMCLRKSLQSEVNEHFCFLLAVVSA